MNVDLKSQIRGLYREMAELQEPIDLTEIQRRGRSVRAVEPLRVKPRRSLARNVMIAAGAAVIVAVVFLVPLWFTGSPLGGVSRPPADQPRIVPPVHDDPVGVVEAALDAYNQGDWDAFAAHYVAADVRSGANRTILGGLMAANNQISVSRPCEIAAEPVLATGTQVECGLIMRDDMHGTGGLDVTVDTSFVVDDGLLVTSDFGLLQPEWARYGAFDAAFITWLSSAYPDEYTEYTKHMSSGHPDLPSKTQIGLAFGNLPDEDGMPIALKHVAEFVAQSDQYAAP